MLKFLMCFEVILFQQQNKNVFQQKIFNFIYRFLYIKWLLEFYNLI